MKKKILPLIFSSVVLLTACNGNTSSSTTENSDNIANQATSETTAKKDEEHPLEITSKTASTTQLFQDARSFSDKVAWVYQKDCWHLIDEQGKIKFSLADKEFPNTNFVNGSAVVDKARMIDKTGK
ncbi:hypothetical protein M2139_001380 [Enterococcus sp. PF1-24]|uniref:hypothetical protein n=1 Tax=unclassified Enterococcus TaxID=2608891 RepID=UPI002473B60A|nr:MULTISPECIES: hypothetical protein [unclassified Enterococcus]MDH6364315.1 hypothetical protein [Enterococcus sp. PFB1-1]MDH6401496.1 hypothetical protein [Enterococcus sp. PF1-24]